MTPGSKSDLIRFFDKHLPSRHLVLGKKQYDNKRRLQHVQYNIICTYIIIIITLFVAVLVTVYQKIVGCGGWQWVTVGSGEKYCNYYRWNTRARSPFVFSLLQPCHLGLYIDHILQYITLYIYSQLGWIGQSVSRLLVGFYLYVYNIRVPGKTTSYVNTNTL